MINKGILNLSESESKRIKIEDDIFLCLNYFVEEKEFEISFENKKHKSLNFPSNINVSCVSEQNGYRRHYRPNVFDDTVIVQVPDNFTITYKDKKILEFANEVRYNITGLPHVEVETIIL